VALVARRRRRRRRFRLGGGLLVVLWEVVWCRLLLFLLEEEEEEEEKGLVVRVMAWKTGFVRGIGVDAYLEAWIDARTQVQIERLMAMADRERIVKLALILLLKVWYLRLHRTAQASVETWKYIAVFKF